MKQNTEFEIFAEYGTGDVIKSFLEEFDYVATIDQTDVYYDTKDKKLWNQACFLRVRDNSVIDIKYSKDSRDTSHLFCEETTFKLPLNEKTKEQFRTALLNFIPSCDEGKDDIFEAFGLEKFVTIKKHREKYKNDKYELVIDTIEDLGKFFEIEVLDGNNEDNKAELINFVKDKNINRIPIGYVELFLRKNDYNTYITGRYLLDEDKNK